MDGFFGFCGARVYVPDDAPNLESPSDAALRIFRERLQEALKPQGDNETPNV